MWCGVKWCKSCITIQTSNIKIKKWHPIVLDGKLFYVYDICIFSLISCGSHSVILWKDKGHIMSWIYASCLCVWNPWLWGTHLLGPSESCALNSIGCWHKTHWAQATPIWTMHLWDAWGFPILFVYCFPDYNLSFYWFFHISDLSWLLLLVPCLRL